MYSMHVMLRAVTVVIGIIVTQYHKPAGRHLLYSHTLSILFHNGMTTFSLVMNEFMTTNA